MQIYKITNKKNNLIYIGKTARNARLRIVEHKSKRSLIGQAISLYGEDNFDVEIIDSASSSKELAEKERYWIKKYNSFSPNGYNIAYGSSCYGENKGSYGKHQSEKSILTMKQHQPFRKSILCLDNGLIFSSIRECAKAIGLSKTHIARLCNGQSKSKKYHLQYAN